MRRTIWAGVLLAAMSGAGIVGCGSGGSDGAGDGAATNDGTTTTASAAVSEAAFVDQLDELCVELDEYFAPAIESALASTREVVNAVQTTDPAALGPVFATAAEGFGQAAQLVLDAKAQFAALAAPADAEATITEAEEALGAIGQLLTDVRDAAADEDLAAFAAGAQQLAEFGQEELDAASAELEALGATDCRPASG